MANTFSDFGLRTALRAQARASTKAQAMFSSNPGQAARPLVRGVQMLYAKALCQGGQSLIKRPQLNSRRQQCGRK